MSQALIYSMTVPATPTSDSYLCFRQDRWKDSVVKPNGFKNPFLAGEPLVFERTTEDLVYWKSENAVGRICSQRIRRISNFPQRDFWTARRV